MYRYTSFHRFYNLYPFRRGPERGAVRVAQHALLVGHVRGIVRTLVLFKIVNQFAWVKLRQQSYPTLMSKPILRASSLTSSRSSSTEGSFDVLFSKCHNNGPSRDQPTAEVKQLDERRTNVDPNTTWGQNLMHETQVVDDVFRLEKLISRTLLILPNAQLAVSMK